MLTTGRRGPRTLRNALMSGSLCSLIMLLTREMHSSLARLLGFSDNLSKRRGELRAVKVNLKALAPEETIKSAEMGQVRVARRRRLVGEVRFRQITPIGLGEMQIYSSQLVKPDNCRCERKKKQRKRKRAAEVKRRRRRKVDIESLVSSASAGELCSRDPVSADQ
jgi:hypothetical protein